jgi:outer membrane lipopolysaccharide assembly protein LptE/RlpB
MKRVTLLLSPLLCLYVSACGYHIAGRDTAIPKTVHVIAVPALENKTSSYRLSPSNEKSRLRNPTHRKSYSIPTIFFSEMNTSFPQM